MDNGSPNPSKANSEYNYCSPSEGGEAELRKKGSFVYSSSVSKQHKYLPRPMTVGGLPSTIPSPEYINLKSECNSYARPQADTPQKPNCTQNTSISAEEQKSNPNCATVTSNEEYLNMNFEQDSAHSERSSQGLFQIESKSIIGNKGKVNKIR